MSFLIKIGLLILYGLPDNLNMNKLNKKVQNIVLVLFALISSHAAAGTCITGARDFEKNKAAFPSMFRNLPISLKADPESNTDAAINITTQGDTVKLSGYKKVAGIKFSEDGAVKKVCIEGSTVTFTLDNNKTYPVKINANSVIIMSTPFLLASNKKFSTGVVSSGSSGKAQAGVK